MFGQQQCSIEVRCCCYDAVNNSDVTPLPIGKSIKHKTFPKNWWAGKPGRPSLSILGSHLVARSRTTATGKRLL